MEVLLSTAPVFENFGTGTRASPLARALPCGDVEVKLMDCQSTILCKGRSKVDLERTSSGEQLTEASRSGTTLRVEGSSCSYDPLADSDMGQNSRCQSNGVLLSFVRDG